MDAVNPLNYAPKPRAAQRAWRWVYRLIFLAAITIAALQWGANLLTHLNTIYWEHECLQYLQPPNHVVFEFLRSNIVHEENCIPKNRFMGAGKLSNTMSDGEIFLHQMCRPDGSRYLVSLSLSPAYPNGIEKWRFQALQWTVSFSPQLISWQNPSFVTDPVTSPSHWKFFAGQPDPNNLSHFTFDYDLDGTRNICDAWLNNDGQLIISRRP
jgi:hypothetical protein